MPVRNIIRIDENKCDGCGLCVTACAEGAIQIVDGKARLISDTYCDGLGACLGECPQGAITVEQREARLFNETAVQLHLASQKASQFAKPKQHFAGCPGSRSQTLTPPHSAPTPMNHMPADSQLSHWPVQLMLVPPHAPFLQGADLVICADCVPFAVPDFHSRYLKGRSVVVGCPKLDNLSHYHEKIEQILTVAKPSRVTVLIMEVPCCGGLAHSVAQARNELTPNLPMEIHTIGIKGDIDEQVVPASTPPGRRL